MRPTTKAEPRFDFQLKYGLDGERLAENYTEWFVTGNHVEVKRKTYLDLDFYIETHNDPGRTGVYRPSGINVTTAEVWAFVVDDTGIVLFVPTDLVRLMLDDPSTRDRAEADGSCPTKGKLIKLAVLLYRYKQRRDHANDDNGTIDREIERLDRKRAAACR